MPACRRSLPVVIAALVALTFALSASGALSASASTADDLEAAKQQLTVARAAANDARAVAHEAEVKLQQTEDRIADLEATIADLKEQAAALQAIVRKRAVYEYTHAANDIDTIIGTDDTLSFARGKMLIDLSNQKDNTAGRKLAAVNSDLRDETSQLRDLESKQHATRDQLAARNNELQAKLVESQQAASALQAKYDAEIAAQREAERKAQLERERAAIALLVAKPISNPTPANLSAGQVVANPNPNPNPSPARNAVGGFMCPVFGAAYTDDFGGPRAHGGIDMFVPTGTQAFAVKSGTVRYVPNEGAGGNTAYLNADDGNTYFYAHLSQFVGGPRTVAQGEVIALTGMTGNARGPHLHFEIRIGGDNGGKTNPYPTLRAAGC
jgi:peptidoglycan LD-endopeptidase LytH